jgi:hypothetical protein
MLDVAWRDRLEPLARALWVGVIVLVAGKAFFAPASHSVYLGYEQSATDWPLSGPFRSLNSIQHLPYFSDLMAPFAACPLRYGELAWALVLLTIYAGGLLAFLNRFPVTGDPERPFAGRGLALLVTLLVGGGSLMNHQSNTLIVGCWLWGAVAVRGKRWWLAAFLFAVSGFKLYSLAVGLVFAALYPRQLAPRFAAVLVGLLALPCLFHPTDAVAYRLTTLVSYLTTGAHYKMFTGYVTLYETWRRYVGPVDAANLLPIQAGLGAAVPVVLWLLRRRGVPAAQLERHALFLASVWCVSFGPSIEPHTYLLAAPMIGWLTARCFQGDRPSLKLGAPLLVLALLAGSPLTALSPGLRDFAHGSKVSCVGMMALYLALLTAGTARVARGAGRRDVGREAVPAA